MKLGRLGVWSWLDSFDRAQTADLAGRVEQLGYAALWVPEAVGRDPFTLLGYLAGQTTSLCLATGIANIYARDPMAIMRRAKHWPTCRVGASFSASAYPMPTWSTGCAGTITASHCQPCAITSIAWKALYTWPTNPKTRAS